jgi:hypothetical protein
MASISVPGVFFCSNPHCLLLGKHGLSPCQGGGPRAPFLFSRGVTGMADPTRPPVCPFPFFHHLVMCYDPVRPEFLVRPQLLTHIYSPLWRHPLAIRFLTFHRPTKQKRRSTSQGAKRPLTISGLKKNGSRMALWPRTFAPQASVMASGIRDEVGHEYTCFMRRGKAHVFMHDLVENQWRSDNESRSNLVLLGLSDV